MPSTVHPPLMVTSSGRRSAGRGPSASSTACSSGCLPCGTRRSSSPSPRACTSTERRAWAPSVPPSSTPSGCAASATCTAPMPTGCSRTTTRSRSPTRAPSTASARSPTRWSTCARPLPRPSRRASSAGPRADLLLARVKSTFYAERALVAALDRGNEEHEQLRAWLPDGRVERKREDAFELLQAMRRDLDEGFERFRPAWTLQRTRYWEEARRSVELASGDDPGPTADAALDAVLDEARLDPDAYGRLADRSLLAALARSAAATAGVDVSPWAHEVARRGGAEGPRPARARRPGHVARRARSRPLRPARGRTTAGGAALGARRSSRRRRRRDGAGRPLRRRVRAALRPRGAQARRGRIAPVRSSDPRRRRARRVVLPGAARRGGTRCARRLGDGERLASRRRARSGAPTRVVVRVVGRSVGSPR